VCAVSHRQIQEQGRSRQLVDQHACARPDIADALIAWGIEGIFGIGTHAALFTLSPCGEDE
jgi:hypothetical protein